MSGRWGAWAGDDELARLRAGVVVAAVAGTGSQAHHTCRTAINNNKYVPVIFLRNKNKIKFRRHAIQTFMAWTLVALVQLSF